MKNKQSALSNSVSHVVDILGSTIGRDQPIMLVQTALELVNTLSDDVFLDENFVFLDPFCKAGEILLALGLRLNKATKKLMNVNKICETLYKQNRIFGLAPDERHWLLSLRTYLGNDKSHDISHSQIIRNGAYLSELDGRVDYDRFKMELAKMIEFIQEKKPGCKVIAIGNPPYQEADGGESTGATPVYNLFVNSLIESKFISEFVVVIPSRWFGAGRGLDKFRTNLSNSHCVKRIQFFKKAEDVFPTVQIKGGVCFLHYQKSHQGNCEFKEGNAVYEIDLSKFDIIPDDPLAASLITKILSKHKSKFVGEVAWARKPFGLPTNYFKTLAKKKSLPNCKTVSCFTNGRKIGQALLFDVTINSDKIDQWKVAVSGAYGLGMRRCTLPAKQMFLIEKGVICTETYNIIATFREKSDAEKFLNYLQTTFSRYFLGLRKITQHVPRDRWNWVPLMDMKETWDDEKLFKFFGFSKKEQEHIKAKVEEWS